MRPEEVNYTDTRKHYFDISNGEVLAGLDDRNRYIEAGAQAIHIVELGDLLRDPAPHFDPRTAPYEKIDTSDWPRERFVDFTRWLSRIVSPPDRPHERKVNISVIWHARQLGLGPGIHAIKKEFGSYTSLYQEARIGRVHTVGLFDDWDVEDAVAYIKKVGAGKRPKVADLRRRNKANPNNPQAGYLTDRFRQIGGFRKLLELAGYPVVHHWDKDDYIDWGVRFMRANDGQVPSQSMIDYLSKQDRGPSASIVAKHFDYLSNFQLKTITRFYEYKQEMESRDHVQLEKIEADLDAGMVPLEVFSSFPHDPDASEEEVLEIHQELDRIYGIEPLKSIIEELGVKEAITRYAKFKVLEEVVPNLELQTKLAISRGLTGRNFITSIRKHNRVSPGDIEYIALVEDFFDYIWPDDTRVESLKLDGGYKKYIDRQSQQAKRRRYAKQKVTVRG